MTMAAFFTIMAVVAGLRNPDSLRDTECPKLHRTVTEVIKAC